MELYNYFHVLFLIIESNYVAYKLNLSYVCNICLIHALQIHGIYPTSVHVCEIA